MCVWNKYYLQYMCGISITYIYVSLLFIVSVGGTREIRNLVGQPATVTSNELTTPRAHSFAIWGGRSTEKQPIASTSKNTDENQTKRKSPRKNTQYARSAALRTPAATVGQLFLFA